ncbi:hypothetical protein [Actinacidiphila yeochonensis]|uniref:hypothetical protein n=1 Tax=Actinacidiphila yeochonensis TaxID=89050 RepID=UPI00056D1B83|nr:hypothetical protein [Actinacidiphila yeochonensis]
MPDAAGDAYRVVVAHESFDFRRPLGDTLADLLDDFSDALEELQADGSVAAWASWASHDCRDELPLYDFLYAGGSGPDAVSPDVRRRLSRLMDKCRLWDDDEAEKIPDDVVVAGESTAWPSAVGHAMLRSLRGLTTACLLFPTAATASGWQPVSSGSESASESEPLATAVYFLRRAPEITGFWRALFDREDVDEAGFPVLAGRAFPRLILAEGLSFGRFTGHYRDLRPWVVQVLSVVNDRFADAVAENAGLPRQVQAALGGSGITLSPESSRTRANESVMRLRDVEHDGGTYRCEWHAKQHPTHNRVHFSLPGQRSDGKVLIGIFVDHLPT